VGRKAERGQAMKEKVDYHAELFEDDEFVASVYHDTEEDAMREIMNYADMKAETLTIVLRKSIFVKTIIIGGKS
jgi:hypothetical protein